jgi:SAM-dependent methyltransferase
MRATTATTRTSLLSAAQIDALYRERVLVNDDPAYLRRYERFDFTAEFGADALRRMEFPRLVIILEFKRIVAAHAIESEQLLMLNGGASADPEAQHLPHRAVEFADYATDPERHDLHRLHVARDDFDFVLMSQTLEHLYNPLLALANLRSVMRPDGYLWTSVPTVSRQHQLPAHFQTGFTPIGLACLLAQSGFEVLEIGQWGNAKYISHLFDLGLLPTIHDLRRASLRARGLGHVARAAQRLSPRNFLSAGLHNEFEHPAQTWALARRSRPPAA